MLFLVMLCQYNYYLHFMYSTSTWVWDFGDHFPSLLAYNQTLWPVLARSHICIAYGNCIAFNTFALFGILLLLLNDLHDPKPTLYFHFISSSAQQALC